MFAMMSGNDCWLLAVMIAPITFDPHACLLGQRQHAHSESRVRAAAAATIGAAARQIAVGQRRIPILRRLPHVRVIEHTALYFQCIGRAHARDRVSAEARCGRWRES